MTIGLNVKHGDKLVVLLNLSRLWLWANFYEDEVDLLREAESMTVVFPALANRSFEGKISVITPTIYPVKRTTLVRVEIPNPDGQLRPGMYANVIADIDAGEGLTIPFESALPTGSQMLVFVDMGFGNLEPRVLHAGRQLVEVGEKMKNATIKSSAGCKKENVLFRPGTF